MHTKCLILVEGDNLTEDSLMGVSLGAAKQVIVGNAIGFGIVLSIGANSYDAINNALVKFAEVPNVTRIITLAHLRS